MIPSMILAFSSASALALAIGGASMLAPLSKTRLLAAKVFVAAMTLSAVFVSIQSNPYVQLQCAIIHFCTLTPILLTWITILVRFQILLKRIDAQQVRLGNLEASVKSRTTEKQPQIKVEMKTK